VVSHNLEAKVDLIAVVTRQITNEEWGKLKRLDVKEKDQLISKIF